MSMFGIDVPAPDELNYHEACQVQRVQRALQRIDPGDVPAVIDGRIAAESDPKAHPLYALICFFLDRQRAMDGGQFYDWSVRGSSIRI
jgi:hypothetical protein